MDKIKNWVKLFRIKHYIKNILIFVPLFFSKQVSSENITMAILGFICFSIGASIVYIINDINDIENDKKHSTKRNRPLPSGKISITEAKISIFLLLIIVLSINMVILRNSASFLILVFYIIINIAYSTKLKSIPIMDVCILEIGYLLRIYYGANLFGIDISGWLYLTIMSGSFFMGLGKRRGELNKKDSNDTRKVLKYYNAQFLDKNMYVSLGTCIAFYSMWCFEASKIYENEKLLWTVAIVWIIFMRYSLIIEGTSDGDPINVLLDDKTLMLLSILYIIMITIFIYF